MPKESSMFACRSRKFCCCFASAATSRATVMVRIDPGPRGGPPGAEVGSSSDGNSRRCAFGPSSIAIPASSFPSVNVTACLAMVPLQRRSWAPTLFHFASRARAADRRRRHGSHTVCNGLLESSCSFISRCRRVLSQWTRSKLEGDHVALSRR